MEKVFIADSTLRNCDISLSFKEKTKIAKLLNDANIDVIETSPITDGKSDVLFLHSIAPIIDASILACPVSLDCESVVKTYEAISGAAKPRLIISVPVSTVQMEYLYHKKSKALFEIVKDASQKACELCNDVELELVDATRGEEDFIIRLINMAKEIGIKTVTLCDTVGETIPSEIAEFIENLISKAPSIKDVCIGIECSDKLKMSSANALACLEKGIRQIETSVGENQITDLASVASIIRARFDSLGFKSDINIERTDKTIKKIEAILVESTIKSSLDFTIGENESKGLQSGFTKSELKKTIKELGYDLSGDEIEAVFDEAKKLDKSLIGKEIDAIIASVTAQVPPTYKLKSYVINNGNIITPTANIVLEKDGEDKQGFCIGEGPIDAAFLAIEQITGHHYELDDYQVQSVTEGREAMASSVIKLRSDGKIYAGRGISIDVIGAGISAYINALNKICFEEKQ